MDAERYFDTASSEPLHPAAREGLLAALDRGYADPRRLHASARDARLILDNAREAVAQALGVRRDEVSFTSSGTDAVHRGLLGLAGPNAVVAHSQVEHSAVLHALAWRQDLQARPVPVDETGRIKLDQIGAADVIALQSANHEIGTLQPVAEAAQRGVAVFTDACASMGRLPMPDGWTVAAGSAHKWGGPAGVGILLVRKGAPWRNPFPGDDRIDERVSGFENVPAILAAAAALQAVVAERDEVNARQHALIERVRSAVGQIPDAQVVGDPVDRLPHLVTFSFLYVDGEALVDALNRRGFEVASGSACTASSLQPSHVLAAIGALTHGNVRLSLTRDANPGRIEALLTALPEIVGEIRAEAGL